MTEVPSGWYPDPRGLADERYHDGNEWTDQTRSSQATKAGVAMDYKHYEYPTWGPYVGWKKHKETGQWIPLAPDETQTMLLRVTADHTLILGRIRSWLMWLFLCLVTVPLLIGFVLVATSP